jgi:parallel beta-helix repeat protein
MNLSVTLILAVILLLQVTTIQQVTAQPLSISITADGNVEGTSTIQRNGNVYTFTSNLEASITIEANNTVLDGAGFTLKGMGDSVGIVAYDKNAVIIRNVNVENFHIGILLGHYSPDAFLWYDPNPNRPTNCTVNNCYVSNNTKGISITGGRQCRIIGNQVANSKEGITVSGSGTFFRNNQMENNTLNFVDINPEKSDVDASNTINGKPIYYLINPQNKTVPADASMIYLECCSNMTVSNFDIKYTYKAISLLNSSNCKIYGNTLTDNQVGVALRNSPNNTIIANELRGNSDNAIEHYDSENNTITNNLIRANGGGIDSSGYTVSGSGNDVISSNQIIANGGCGIQAGRGCTIIGNYIEGNGRHGIFFYDVSNSRVYKNNITNNGDYGLSFQKGKNASINGNDISKNNIGIKMGDPHNCTITENNIAQNTNLAIKSDDDMKDNSIYLNNFIDNNNGSIQVSIKGRFVWKGDEYYNENSTVFPQYATSYNEWDTGSMGNFWSDHNPTADKAAYKIADRNIDHHPLLTPIEFSALELPSTEVTQELAELTKNPETEPESFPTMIVAVTTFVIVLAVTSGLMVYFKKRKH